MDGGHWGVWTLGHVKKSHWGVLFVDIGACFLDIGYRYGVWQQVRPRLPFSALHLNHAPFDKNVTYPLMSRFPTQASTMGDVHLDQRDSHWDTMSWLPLSPIGGQIPCLINCLIHGTAWGQIVGPCFRMTGNIAFDLAECNGLIREPCISLNWAFSSLTTKWVLRCC